MPIKPGSRRCLDRVIPIHLKVRAAELAMKENGVNHPKVGALSAVPKKRAAALMPGASGHPVKIAFFTGKKWKKGRTLGIQFLDGSPAQKQKAQHFAEKWLPSVNLKFNFNAGGAAEVRVSFQSDPGSSWSAIGTDALVTEYFKKSEPTMNFGWLEDDTEADEWERVVVHEFGHAIGAIHEHQNPKSGIEWNLPAVYASFSGPPNNWSKEDIDFNIVQKYSIDQLNATNFDPASIMLYSFPAELIKGGKATAENKKLSKLDKAFAAKMYPKK